MLSKLSSTLSTIQSFGHHYLGTEHLQMGVLREEEGLASQVLSSSGVTLEKTRGIVKQLLATV
jgi:ATP-dependent Clp protease ATP-binding subunit ClpC